MRRDNGLQNRGHVDALDRSDWPIPQRGPMAGEIAAGVAIGGRPQLALLDREITLGDDAKRHSRGGGLDFGHAPVGRRVLAQLCLRKALPGGLARFLKCYFANIAETFTPLLAADAELNQKSSIAAAQTNTKTRHSVVPDHGVVFVDGRDQRGDIPGG
jgi:hypothetical protein